MQKYTIVDLNGMTEEQLKEVASELEITKMASEKKEIIYQILDAQAEAVATQTVEQQQSNKRKEKQGNSRNNKAGTLHCSSLVRRETDTYIQPVSNFNAMEKIEI